MAESPDVVDIFFAVLSKKQKREDTAVRMQGLTDADWQRLYALSTETGLFAAFYVRLLALSLDSYPAEFLPRLKNIFLLNLHRNVLFEQELLKVLACLKQHSIPAIPLKGPALARFLYNDLSLRGAPCDLDVLIPHDKIVPAVEAFKERGFIVSSEDNAQDYAKTLAYVRQLHLQGASETLGAYELDLHWDFRNRYILTHREDFWRNAREIDLDGYQVLFPAAEDLLLFLAITAISDYDFVEIRYLYDIHTLLSSQGKEVAWERLAAKAKQHGLATVLFFALRLSADFFSTPLNKEAMDAVRPPRIKEKIITAWVNKRNILDARKKIASGYVWRHFLSSYMFSKNIAGGMRVSFKKIFLPVQQVRQMHNERKTNAVYLAYIERLLRPFSRAGKSILEKIVFRLQKYNVYKIAGGILLAGSVRYRMETAGEQRYRFFAAKFDQGVASVYLEYAEDRLPQGWYLNALQVSFFYRRLGIARNLLRNCLAFAKQKGIRQVYVVVFRQNSAALKLYQNTGLNMEVLEERAAGDIQNAHCIMRVSL